MCGLVVASLFGLALSFNGDDDPCACLRAADDLWFSAAETPGGPLLEDAHQALAASDRTTDVPTANFLAAVPGGLCLLI